ncbi:hypothetical protein BB558_001906 [Smittium angustum]|uniref:Uncharacterized protein n=1 Tax=Smittium angustum TaxID=133377 RepID=A0A2U1JA44_SMIAN|nr:hypothetical protein BB558_001906 [Smittium angustum]
MVQQSTSSNPSNLSGVLRTPKRYNRHNSSPYARSETKTSNGNVLVSVRNLLSKIWTDSPNKEINSPTVNNQYQKSSHTPRHVQSQILRKNQNMTNTPGIDFENSKETPSLPLNVFNGDAGTSRSTDKILETPTFTTSSSSNQSGSKSSLASRNNGAATRNRFITPGKWSSNYELVYNARPRPNTSAKKSSWLENNNIYQNEIGNYTTEQPSNAQNNFTITPLNMSSRTTNTSTESNMSTASYTPNTRRRVAAWMSPAHAQRLLESLEVPKSQIMDNEEISLDEPSSTNIVNTFNKSSQTTRENNQTAKPEKPLSVAKKIPAIQRESTATIRRVNSLGIISSSQSLAKMIQQNQAKRILERFHKPEPHKLNENLSTNISSYPSDLETNGVSKDENPKWIQSKTRKREDLEEDETVSSVKRRRDEKTEKDSAKAGEPTNERSSKPITKKTLQSSQSRLVEQRAAGRKKLLEIRKNRKPISDQPKIQWRFSARFLGDEDDEKNSKDEEMDQDTGSSDDESMIKVPENPKLNQKLSLSLNNAVGPSILVLSGNRAAKLKIPTEPLQMPKRRPFHAVQETKAPTTLFGSQSKAEESQSSLFTSAAVSTSTPQTEALKTETQIPSILNRLGSKTDDTMANGFGDIKKRKDTGETAVSTSNLFEQKSKVLEQKKPGFDSGLFTEKPSNLTGESAEPKKVSFQFGSKPDTTKLQNDQPTTTATQKPLFGIETSSNDTSKPKPFGSLFSNIDKNVDLGKPNQEKTETQTGVALPPFSSTPASTGSLFSFGAQTDKSKDENETKKSEEKPKPFQFSIPAAGSVKPNENKPSGAEESNNKVENITFGKPGSTPSTFSTGGFSFGSGKPALDGEKAETIKPTFQFSQNPVVPSTTTATNTVTSASTNLFSGSASLATNQSPQIFQPSGNNGTFLAPNTQKTIGKDETTSTSVGLFGSKPTEPTAAIGSGTSTQPKMTFQFGTTKTDDSTKSPFGTSLGFKPASEASTNVATPTATATSGLFNFSSNKSETKTSPAIFSGFGQSAGTTTVPGAATGASGNTFGGSLFNSGNTATSTATSLFGPTSGKDVNNNAPSSNFISGTGGISSAGYAFGSSNTASSAPLSASLQGQPKTNSGMEISMGTGSKNQNEQSLFGANKTSTSTFNFGSSNGLSSSFGTQPKPTNALQPSEPKSFGSLFGQQNAAGGTGVSTTLQSSSTPNLFSFGEKQSGNGFSNFQQPSTTAGGFNSSSTNLTTFGSQSSGFGAGSASVTPSIPGQQTFSFGKSSGAQTQNMFQPSTGTIFGGQSMGMDGGNNSSGGSLFSVPGQQQQGVVRAPSFSSQSSAGFNFGSNSASMNMNEGGNSSGVFSFNAGPTSEAGGFSLGTAPPSSIQGRKIARPRRKI